jgi:hypothetical protein
VPNVMNLSHATKIGLILFFGHAVRHPSKM